MSEDVRRSSDCPITTLAVRTVELGLTDRGRERLTMLNGMFDCIDGRAESLRAEPELAPTPTGSPDQ